MQPVNRTGCVSASLLTVAFVIAGHASAANVDMARFPALSPDGATVVFSWRGDLWRAPSVGGEAVRLTSGPASDLRSGFTPDGARVVFESDRDGMRNLWSMRADGADLRQLTDLDATFSLSSVGLFRGRPVAFIETTIEGDLYRSPRPYMLPLDVADGTIGTPLRVHDAFGGAMTASGDGASALFERGGSPWLRRGYTGPDNRNVWLFDANAGTFAQLTKHEGNDGVPRFIGAGEFVYISDRGLGALNVHRAKVGDPADSGARLTEFKDADVQGLAVSGDGRTAVCMVEGDLWRIDLATPGAQAERLSFTAAEDGPIDREFKQVGRDVSEATLSPDGKTMAFVAFGDVFVRAIEEKSPTRRVTEGEAREREICWSADGLTLYFVSDRDGSDSIYAARVVETRAEARERGKPKIEKAPEPVAEPAKPEPAKSEPLAAEPAAMEPAAMEPAAAEPAKADVPAADGTKQDGVNADAGTTQPEKKEPEKREPEKKDPALDPARWADAVRFDIKAVTTGADDDRSPVAVPDGSALLFNRNAGTLVRLDLVTNDIKIIRSGWNSTLDVVCSADGALIAFSESDQNFNIDIWVAPSDGSKEPVNVTRHPDNDQSPRFSADGRILAFLSERTNEEYDVWMVNLDRELDGLSQRDLDQYFKDAAEAHKKRKPVEPRAAKAEKDSPEGDDSKKSANDEKSKSDGSKSEGSKSEGSKSEGSKGEAIKPATFDELELDDAYLRVRRVTSVLGNEDGVLLASAGDRLFFTGTDGKDRALFSIKPDGSEQKRLGGPVQITELSFAGDRIVAVASGQAQTITPSGESKTIDISAESEIDLARRNEQKLRETSRILGRKFYLDPKEKGLDWPALTERYAKLALRARTASEFDFVANTFIGHLDASHLGVSSPGSDGPSRRAHGRLGVTTVAAEGGRRVTEVLPNSPAALAKPPIEVGDLIVAVEFVRIDPAKTLESALAGKIGQEVFVEFTRAASAPDAPQRELGALVVPIASAAERTLRYNDETSTMARKVDALSGGRLGYIHIAGMDQASLDRFERDLYAAADGKDGLIVDVRNNGGGSTADRLLASIDVRPHAYTMPRGGDRTRKNGYPQDRLFIQRYTLPMAMLCNEKSFSNAEIISHAFKTLGRGPLVGQRTAGGVISTGGEALVDGTTVRVPFRGWYLPGDKDMEENGAMPDFVVPQTPEEESKGIDAQLAKAVEELLRDLGSKKSEKP
jgi:tricorn protease